VTHLVGEDQLHRFGIASRHEVVVQHDPLGGAQAGEIGIALLGPAAGVGFVHLLDGDSRPVRQGQDTPFERRIREVTVERDLQALERAVKRYREERGTVPAELSDIVRAGILRGIPEEPNGGRYLMEPGGKVRSDRVSQRLRVFHSR